MAVVHTVLDLVAVHHTLVPEAGKMNGRVVEALHMERRSLGLEEGHSLEEAAGRSLAVETAVESLVADMLLVVDMLRSGQQVIWYILKVFNAQRHGAFPRVLTWLAAIAILARGRRTTWWRVI